MPMAYHSKPNLTPLYMLLSMVLTCLLMVLGRRVILPALEDFPAWEPLAPSQWPDYLV